MSDAQNRPTDDPADIQRHIEQTQDDLRRNVDALGHRLSPESVAAEAGARVRDTVSEGMRGAGEALRAQMDRTFDGLEGRDDWAAWGLVGTVALIGLGFVVMRLAGPEGERERPAFRDREAREPSERLVPEGPPRPAPLEG